MAPRDLLVHLALQLGRVLHWYNPLVWFATREARVDCELACDEFVLRRQAGSPRNYGAALLKVISSTRRPLGNSVAVGIVENPGQLRDRILRIARYRRSSSGRGLLGATLMLVLTVTSATHETWAREAVSAVVAALGNSAPAGWRRMSGSVEKTVQIGVDANVRFHGAPTGCVRVTENDPRMADWNVCGFAQACLADDFRGHRVRFSAWMKTADVRGTAGLWLRVDAEKRHGLQFDNMRNQPVRGTSGWARYSVVLDVPPEAVSLNYGFSVLGGTGTAWFAEPTLEIVGHEVASTNIEHTPPSVCGNPNCSSSIMARGTPRRSLVNPKFAACPAP